METLPPKEEIGVTRAVKGVPHAVFIRVIPQRRSALGMSGDALFKGRKTRELSGKKLRHHRSVVRDHQRAESPADRLARCSLNFDTDETFPLSLSRREEDVSESHQVRQLPTPQKWEFQHLRRKEQREETLSWQLIVRRTARQQHFSPESRRSLSAAPSDG